MSSEKARQSEDGHHCGGRTAPEPLPEVDFEEFVPSDYEGERRRAKASSNFSREVDCPIIFLSVAWFRIGIMIFCNGIIA